MTEEINELVLEPEPPTNVWIETSRGEHLPVELRYLGQDAEGIHIWQAVPTSPGLTMAGGGVLHVDQLPPMTAVGVKVWDLE